MIRRTTHRAVVASLMSESGLVSALLVRLKALRRLLLEVGAGRSMSRTIGSIVMETLLFREGYKPLEFIGCIVELIASSVEVELSLGEHVAIRLKEVS